MNIILIAIYLQDPEILTQWVKAIPRSDRNLRLEIDCVYKKHSIQQFERDRILLKENSVPSLFLDLPYYPSSKTKNRKPQ